MDVSEARKVYEAGWNLPCGHSSDSIGGDYHNTWCRKCGGEVGEPPKIFSEALQVLNADFQKRKNHHQLLEADLKQRLRSFLETNPFGDLAAFVQTLK